VIATHTYASLLDLKRELAETDTRPDLTYDPLGQASLVAATAWIDQVLGYKGIPEQFTWSAKIDGVLYINRSEGTLLLPRPMLEVTQVLDGGRALVVWNGDHGTLSGAELNALTEPLRQSPIVRLERVLGGWPAEWGSGGGPFIIITGIWGYHGDYARAWRSSGFSLSALVDDAADSLTLDVSGDDSDELPQPGVVIRVDTEVMILSSSESDVLEVIRRGDLGSTAAGHAEDTAVEVWQPDPALNYACARLAAMIYKKRGRFETFVINASDIGVSTTIFPKSMPGEVADILEGLPTFDAKRTTLWSFRGPY
jgi:hypothetical protein